MLAHVVTIDGQVRGTWRRTLARDEAVIEVNLPGALEPAEQEALVQAGARFGRFLGMPVRLLW